MSTLLIIEALAASYKLILRGNDAVIVDPSLVGLPNCLSSARILPLTSYVELVFINSALEAYGINMGRFCWFLWFRYRCWCLYFEDLVEHCAEFFLRHHVCFDPHCCSSGPLGRLTGDMCAICSTSGPLVLNCLLSNIGGSSVNGGVLDDLSSACACGGSGGALLGNLSSLGTCSSGGALHGDLSSLGTCE